MNIKKELSKVNINTNLTDRWEEGIDHHPKSKHMMKFIAHADMQLNSDYFCWTIGGDGDNGEQLMYLMDLYFEAQEAGILE